MEFDLVRELPAEFLCAVFRGLSLRQKLTCESVCKTWHKLLRGQHVNCRQHLSTAIWGPKLSLHLNMPQPSFLVDRITILEKETDQNELPQILLTAKMSKTSKRTGFLHWFKRIIFMVSTIDITYTDSDSADRYLHVSSGSAAWVFPHLLVALYLAKQGTPSACELHLSTGTSSMLHISLKPVL